MPWSVRLDPTHGLIETIYSGKLTREMCDEAGVEARKLVPDPGPQLFLSDFTEAKVNVSTVGIYDAPGVWERAGVSKAHSLALIVNADERTWTNARFYEDTCRNRGWNVRVFTTRPDAIAWLLTQRKSRDTDHGV